ncbi:MAG: methyltransferase domain-containing protein [Planctomycetota bacterium]|nr:MAG: methyltransferase domain-containing protein [Planctomycetota bacterium]
MRQRSLPLPALIAASLAASLACTAPGGEPTPAPPPALEEPSVKPGVNENFLAEDLDVEEYIERFEGESREVAVHKDGIVDRIGIAPGMAVADIGAGTGLFTGLLAKEVGPEGRVFAVDISPVFIDHLRERSLEEGWSGVDMVLCTEKSAELAAGSIDLAFVCDTYHHFEYPRSTLASLFDALKPGGALVVLDFERIPGVSREWLLGHVRADKQTFTAEITAAGFVLLEEIEVPGLDENYMLRFARP